MNNAINYSGFIELDLKSDDDFEPYGYSEADARPEASINTAQIKTAGLNDYSDE